VRVVVTRAEGQADELAARLRALGHEVVHCPLVRTEAVGGPVDVTGYDWVVVTSPNGAAELARRARGRLPPVAAIGSGTAAALAEHGLEAALVARVSTQEGLADELPRPAGRVLFAGAEGARRHLVDVLGADFVSLYRTIELAPDAFPDADLAVLASPSAARALARTHARLPVVTIGPQTTSAARAGGLEVAAEADAHDLDGLVAAVRRAAR
jgi:uroporphyrinogen-III synthase